MFGFSPPHRRPHLPGRRTDLGAMDGKATRKQIALSFPLGGETFTFGLTLFVPNARPASAPVFLLLNHRGVENTDPTRTKRTEFWPAEDVISRGYAIAAINVAADVEPDRRDATAGVRTLYRQHAAKPDEFTRRPRRVVLGRLARSRLSRDRPRHQSRPKSPSSATRAPARPRSGLPRRIRASPWPA